MCGQNLKWNRTPSIVTILRNKNVDLYNGKKLLCIFHIKIVTVFLVVFFHNNITPKWNYTKNALLKSSFFIGNSCCKSGYQTYTFPVQIPLVGSTIKLVYILYLMFCLDVMFVGIDHVKWQWTSPMAWAPCRHDLTVI